MAFIGGTRYASPLPEAWRKKFRLLRRALGPVHVVASSATGTRTAFVEEGVHFHLAPRLASPLLRLPQRLFWSARTLDRLVRAGEVDVLVAQSPLEGIAALWVARRARQRRQAVAVAIEAHQDFENDPLGQFSLGWGLRRIWQRTLGLQHRALRAADALRCISDDTCRRFAELAPDVPRVRFTAWTDMDAFLAAGTARSVSRETYVLYAGVLIDRKNVHTLIDAFASVAARHPQAHLRLVGSAEDAAYAARLHEQVERHELRGRVRFEPEVSQPELASRMAGAEVFVLPSKSEGLGRVVFEAMATGTPVIGANVGGIPSMVTPGQTGWLVDPADVAALAAALDEALSDPDRTRALGEAARASSERHFSAEAYLEGMTRLVHTARTRAAERMSP